MDKANAKSVQFTSLVFARLTCETRCNRTRAVFLDADTALAHWTKNGARRGYRSFGRRQVSVWRQARSSGGAQDDMPWGAGKNTCIRREGRPLRWERPVDRLVPAVLPSEAG